jgi:hypothetical protein
MEGMYYVVDVTLDLAVIWQENLYSILSFYIGWLSKTVTAPTRQFSQLLTLTLISLFFRFLSPLLSLSGLLMPLESW